MAKSEENPAEGLPGAQAGAVSLDRPGLAWVRPGISTGSATRGAVEVPVANLEPPSMSRFDLTPSPVPRVALAPATGSVDVSLVPGPHAAGSRNMPTLAAQHLVGRRPRRPAAAAVTVPPPPLGARESRMAAGLARDVRSSKGEIVVGLTIGLGVSLLLAGLGQAYLRGEGAIAVEENAASRLEVVTLSARPDVPAGVTGAAPESSGVEPTLDVSTTAVDREAIDDAASLDRSRSESAKRAIPPPPRATPAAKGARRADATGTNDPPLAEDAIAEPSPAPLSPALPTPAPPTPAPLTPAESAGLGLELPF